MIEPPLKRWRVAAHDEGRIRALARAHSLPSLLAQILLARGLHADDDVRSHLFPLMRNLHDPSLLPGVDEAVPRILAAIEQRRPITIYGDYDVDGVTATAILLGCLKLAGADVDYYIPSRLEEGYGINADALRTLAERPGDRLVISVDCGITAVREAELARQLGLELIVTDHHSFGEALPDAVLVHPSIPGSAYPFPYLCGAGVAFKLAWAVCQQLGDGTRASESMREYLVSVMSLLAMATIADVVPLTGENRVFVKHGLQVLSGNAPLQHRKDVRSVGLKALLDVAGLGDKRELEAEDIAFGLAPRINAAGRLGQARLAVELLTTSDPHRAAHLAEYVNELNGNRKTVERKIVKQARELVAENGEWEDHPLLVLAHPEWHPGVIGIAASRIAETCGKPAILIALDEQQQVGRGSGRTCNGFNLHEGLSAAADHLLAFGGHPAAAGLSVQAGSVDALREALVEFANGNGLCEHDEAELAVDAEVMLSDLSHGAVKTLDRLGPFGCGNNRPLLTAGGVELADAPRKMGGGDRHLALRLRQFRGRVFRAVAFGKAEWADEITAVRGPISICFTAGINSFGGYESVELQLVDWQPD